MTDDRLTRRTALTTAGAGLAGLFAGCLGRTDDEEPDGMDGETDTMTGETDTMTGSGGGMNDSGDETNDSTASDGEMSEDPTTAAMTTTDATPVDWRETSLARVRGGESFRIAGLQPPVVLETFAVWCPSCASQQTHMQDLEGVTRVSLNVDANEDAGAVREYLEDRAFDWRYAIAPEAMTAALVDAFGPAVVHPPATPIAVVCPDGSTVFRSGELLNAEEIEALTEEC